MIMPADIVMAGQAVYACGTTHAYATSAHSHFYVYILYATHIFFMAVCMHVYTYPSSHPSIHPCMHACMHDPRMDISLDFLYVSVFLHT